MSSLKVGIINEYLKIPITINDVQIAKRLIFNCRCCCCRSIDRYIMVTQQQAPQVVAVL